MVQHPAYLGQLYGALRPGQTGDYISLGEGESKRDLRIPMSPLMTISGHIYDEAGNGIAGIPVVFYQMRKSLSGRRSMAIARELETGPQGEYSAGVNAGLYLVKAIGREPKVRPNGSDVSASFSGHPQQQFSYGSRFYPHALGPADAVPIEVESKPREKIDVRLPRVPAVSLRVRVENPPPDGSAEPWKKLTLRPETAVGGFDAEVTTSYSVTPQGVLQVQDTIPAGRYGVFVDWIEKSRKLQGFRSVDLVQAREEVSVFLKPLPDLSGVVQLEGDNTAKLPAHLQVRLDRSDGSQFDGATAVIQENGAFQFVGISVGRWRASAPDLAEGMYVKEIRLGGADVLGSDFVIGEDPPPSLKIVIGTQAASLSGKVTEANGHAAIILLVPSGKLRSERQFYYAALADGEGKFTVKGVRPGKYLLLALDDLAQDPVEDLPLWQPYENRGIEVDLAPGTLVSQELVMIRTSGAK